MKRKTKTPDYDDGRTIAEMNVEGMPWYNPTRDKKVNEEDKPTKKELRAMMRGVSGLSSARARHARGIRPLRSPRVFMA